MTPPSASVQSAPHSSHQQLSIDEPSLHVGTEHFADGHWDSDDLGIRVDGSPASYWVRRKRAAAPIDLSS